MNKVSLFAAAGCLLLIASACGGDGKKKKSGFPDNFDTIGDAGRVAYVMGTSTPDSVARFIINTALGRVPGARFDTLANVNLYVFSTYSSKDQDTFSEEYQKLESELTLTERMTLFKKMESEDSREFGLDLGLAYVSRIRDRNMNVDEVDREIKEFRKACGSDSMTYIRFVKGFTTALEYDKGKDVKKEIYDRFASMSAE